MREPALMILTTHMKKIKNKSRLYLMLCGLLIFVITFIIINNFFTSSFYTVENRAILFVYVNIILTLNAVLYIFYSNYKINKNIVHMFYRYLQSDRREEKDFLFYSLMGYLAIHDHYTLKLLERYKGFRLWTK